MSRIGVVLVSAFLSVCLCGSVFGQEGEAPAGSPDAPVPGEQREGERDEAEEAEAARAALEARVEAEVARIEADPPVHERAEPWNVPLSEFENELQPLRREQIDERVAAWVDLLQAEVRRRNRLNIAAQQATGEPALRDALLARAQARQETISKITARLRVAMVELKRRGGEIDEYERYVSNVTGTKLDLTDPSLLAAQAWAWVKSPGGGIALGLKILWFVLIMIGFWIASLLIAAAVASALRRRKKGSALLQDFLVGGTKRTILVIGFVVALGALGVNITPLVAAIGAVGLVIGLALQGTLSNFASGVLILIYKPFDVNDVVTAGGVTGKVESLNLVRTNILTFDNQIHYVPNNEIWNSVITNITGRPTRRVDMSFGIGYRDDVDTAMRIVREVVESNEKVMRDPEPAILMTELGDNSVTIVSRAWAKTEDYWDIYWDVLRRVKDRFGQEGINIPYPQRDLHLVEPIEVVMKNA